MSRKDIRLKPGETYEHKIGDSIHLYVHNDNPEWKKYGYINILQEGEGSITYDDVRIKAVPKSENVDLPVGDVIAIEDKRGKVWFIRART